MSSHQQIMSVYREDQRHPYYSLQSGRTRVWMDRQERRSQWIWGHFQRALEQALMHPVEKAA